MPAVAAAGGLPTRLGKYEIVTPLAAGGMARIYIARTTGIGMFERHVVLKLITPEREKDVIAVQMFLDEARLAASLNHQNVAQVFEVGQDNGIHYLAMEYVHGQDLRALLAKAGGQGTRVPLELALTVVAGAAAGLNHAHERRAPDGTPLGIVHRDVSPSNLMVGYDGSVKLLDFGIAKAAARSVETQSGVIKGKFAYMSPEQCRGRDVDRRSDVFSLGIILYEITTQHRCFRADSDFDTMHRIVTGDVVRPTRIMPGYPPALEAIVMKALSVEPSTRYQSAGALLEAIESFAVSSRMSLSTMSLGRFMRDMFGDSPEPWLVANASPPIEPKETTISSTDGNGAADTTSALDSDAGLEDSEDDMDAAKTFLVAADDASIANDDAFPTTRDPSPRGDQHRAKTVPSGPADPARPTPKGLAAVPAPSGIARPSAPIPATIGSGRATGAVDAVPATVGRARSSGTASVGAVSAPVGRSSGGFDAPARSGTGAVSAMPGSQSGALPAMPSTRHGYASGGGATRGDVAPPAGGAMAPSQPRAAAHASKTNLRPLIIGLTLAGVGIVVLVAVMLGGDEQPADPGGPARIREATPPRASSIAELEVTAPSGAELWLDGKRIDFDSGKPVPVTAGRRTIRIVTPVGACEKQVDLAGGQRVPFTCTPAPKEPPAPEPAPPAATTPAATAPTEPATGANPGATTN